jgi:glycosyltransferase involved in cell wall biosynthesis
MNTHCFVDSRSQLAFLRDNQIVRVDRSSVIGCGSISGISDARFGCVDDRVGLERLAPFAEIDPKTNLNYVFLGRICADKGISTLLAAFEIVLKGFREAAVQLPQLIIAGPVEDEQLGQLLEKSNSNVVFFPGIHRPEDILEIGDIFCSASHREGFGTTIIEAAFMGLPAIGSDIVGFRDSIVDGFTGLLFETGDALAMANAMMKLGLDNEERARLGRNAALRSRLAYRADYYLPKIRNLYVAPKKAHKSSGSPSMPLP